MKKKVAKVENKGINTTELIEAMDELEKNNGIKRNINGINWTSSTCSI